MAGKEDESTLEQPATSAFSRTDHRRWERDESRLLKREWIVPVLLTASTAVSVYLSTIGSYFAADDFGYVQLYANKPALHLLTLFTRSWTEDLWGAPLDELRPFPAVAYQIAGASPPSQHAVNVLIHCVNSTLVLALARQAAGLHPLSAMVAGLLFATMPLNVETVAWLAGRSDLLYASFSLALILSWGAWRRSNKWRYVATACVSFFGALFSKENAIVLPALVVAYDVLVRTPRGRLATWWKDYLPLLMLVGGYVFVRHLAFGDAVRASSLGANTLVDFIEWQAMYVVMLLTGQSVIVHSDLVSPSVAALALAAVALILVIVAVRTSPAAARDSARSFLFVGPVWWVLTTGPLLVAGYATSRHLYLTLCGVAVTGAILVDVLWRSSRRHSRLLALVSVTCVLMLYVSRLVPSVQDWNRGALIAKKIVADLQREMRTAPPGALFLLDVPPVHVSSSLPQGNAVGRPYIGAWIMPHALHPPYMEEDWRHTQMVVAPMVLCCAAEWASAVRGVVSQWSSGSTSSEIRLLQWDPTTGALSTRSSAHDDQLLEQTRALALGTTAKEYRSRLGAIFGHDVY